MFTSSVRIYLSSRRNPPPHHHRPHLYIDVRNFLRKLVRRIRLTCFVISFVYVISNSFITLKCYKMDKYVSNSYYYVILSIVYGINNIWRYSCFWIHCYCIDFWLLWRAHYKFILYLSIARNLLTFAAWIIFYALSLRLPYISLIRVVQHWWGIWLASDLDCALR